MLTSRVSLILGSAAVALSLSACSLTQSSKPQLSADAIKLESKAVSEPALKQVYQVNVGEVMYSEYVLQAGMAAQTTGKRNFAKTILFGDVKLSVSSILEFKPEEDYPTYCSTDFVYYPMNKKTATDVACFADEDEDGWFDRVQVPSVKFGTWTKTDGPTYKVQAVSRKGKARTELWYQGRSAETIKIAYQETNAKGEQTVSQTAEYAMPSTGSTQIGFKKARLVIEKADNQGIRYRVTQGFN